MNLIKRVWRRAQFTTIYDGGPATYGVLPRDTVPATPADANVVCSDIRTGEATPGPGGYHALHMPVIDLDIPATLLPSSTKGHTHLYLDKAVTWKKYCQLLDALSACGLVEPNYVSTSKRRGYTCVRLPWVQKAFPTYHEPPTTHTYHEPPTTHSEHTRPDWADAQVVRDESGTRYHKVGAIGPIEWCSSQNEYWTTQDLAAEHGPITVVLDADGNPPEPDADEIRRCCNARELDKLHQEIAELDRCCNAQARELDELRRAALELKREPEWLDAAALNKLPEWTVVLPDGGGQPRYRDHLGRWRLIGAAGGTSSESAAPARVLWQPGHAS